MIFTKRWAAFVIFEKYRYAQDGVTKVFTGALGHHVFEHDDLPELERIVLYYRSDLEPSGFEFSWTFTEVNPPTAT